LNFLSKTDPFSWFSHFSSKLVRTGFLTDIDIVILGANPNLELLRGCGRWVQEREEWKNALQAWMCDNN
jgi:hypothetical protein